MPVITSELLMYGMIALGVIVFMGVAFWMLHEKNQEILAYKNNSKELNEENRFLSIENAKLEATLEAQTLSYTALKSDFEEQSKKLELKLNMIMDQHLEYMIL